MKQGLLTGAHSDTEFASRFFLSSDRSDMSSASDDGEPEAAAAPLPLRDSALREILSSGMTQGTRITPPALHLSSVFIRSFVEEALHRAAAECQDSGDTEVCSGTTKSCQFAHPFCFRCSICTAQILGEHLEKILPQLLLDFGP